MKQILKCCNNKTLLDKVMSNTKNNIFTIPTRLNRSTSLFSDIVELCEFLGIKMVNAKPKTLYYTPINIKNVYKDDWCRLTLRDGTVFPKCRIYGTQNGVVEGKSFRKRKTNKLLVYKTSVFKCELIHQI